jgi:hypothetical protein
MFDDFKKGPLSASNAPDLSDKRVLGAVSHQFTSAGQLTLGVDANRRSLHYGRDDTFCVMNE